MLDVLNPSDTRTKGIKGMTQMKGVSKRGIYLGKYTCLPQKPIIVCCPGFVSVSSPLQMNLKYHYVKCKRQRISY